MRRWVVWWVLLLAVPVFAQCPPPPASVPLSPVGGVTIGNPFAEFEWAEVPEAVWYQVYIKHNGSLYFRKWLMGETRWNFDQPLPEGNYRWWVRTWSPCGYGPWSAGEPFTLTCGAPPAPTLSFPADTSSYHPHHFYMMGGFVWVGSPSATRAQIRIRKDGVLHERRWVSIGPTQVTRVWRPPASVRFPPGTYTWAVRQYSPCGGIGPWSAEFTVTSKAYHAGPKQPIGLKADLFFPPLAGHGVGFEDSSRRPDFRWNEDALSSWYRVRIRRNGSVYRTFWTRDMGGWRPALNLPAGNYDYDVRGWNPAFGVGPWSSPKFFSLPAAAALDPPGCLYYVPDGLAFGVNASAVNWIPLPGVCRYQVRVRRAGTTIYDGEHEIDLDDGGRGLTRIGHRPGSIVFRPRAYRQPGTYRTWVRGWTKQTGYGPWSAPLAVVCDYPMPKPLTVRPTGLSADTTPLFEWLPTLNAEDYTLYIRREGVKYFEMRLGDGCQSLAYDVSDVPSSFAAVGTARNWRAADQCYGLSLQFAFPFFGTNYTHCYVSTKGVVYFDAPRVDPRASRATLMSHPMIAVMWNDLRTDGALNPTQDIYVYDQPTYMTIRWQGQHYSLSSEVNFSVTLYQTGYIRMRYGPGNWVGGWIGVSAGRNNQVLDSDETGESRNNERDIILAPSGNMHVSAQPYWEFPSGNYTWWIRPHNTSNGDGPWSNPESFSIP